MSNAYPENHPKATTIMVLGILGLVLCQLLGPVAWIMGRGALREIDASGGRLGGRSNVKVGYICGIIGTVALVLAVVAGVVAAVSGGGGDTAEAFGLGAAVFSL
ncbi:DUF4190 domain-containing protein [Nocardia sp. NPDC052566]|uniref:DUF4190 domain-containing protein n=1 Tax=Nocardia sp. NPDC052566 TaxID=3364330 RepID=UPI0037C68F5E